MKAIDLSIIIPVYNTDKYLTYCLDSIVGQKGIEYEIILIDDGSNDNSPIICDEYSKKYDNVRVYHKPNGGVSSARNLGIENSNGKWITFIDSDDFVSPEYIYDISDILSKNIDLIIYNYISYYNDSKKEEGRFILKNGYYNGINALLDMAIQLEIASLSTCTSIYKKEIIEKNHIRFNINMKTCEDFMFNLKYYSNIESYYAIDTPYYYYRQNNESVTHNRKLSHAEDYQLIYDELVRIIDNHVLSTESILIFKERWVKWIIGLIYNFKTQKISNKEINRHVYSQKYYNEIKKSKVNSIKTKIEILLLKYKLNSIILIYCKSVDFTKKILRRYHL